MSAVTTAIAPEIEAAAKAAGLTLTPLEPGKDFAGNPTDRATSRWARRPRRSK